MKNNFKLQKGFSLVEMLVAIAVFMTVMTISVSALMTIINSNKKAQAIKTTTDNVTFAIENISRDMRMGTDYQCLINGSFSKICKNGTSIPGSSAVAYVGADGKAVKYEFTLPAGTTNGTLTRTVCPTASPYCNTPLSFDYLISPDSDAKIGNVTFYVIGADTELTDPRTEPRVVITVSGTISAKGSADTTFNLQTNISQRVRN